MSNEFRFTKPKVDALPPATPGKRDEYRDATQPGLWLRVSPAGTKTYAVLARKKGGALERVTIGTADKITPEIARTQAKRIIADLALGVSHSAAAKARRGESTFDELLQDYLEATPMKPKSLQTFRGFYERHIKAELGRRTLTDITPDRLLALHRKVSQDTPTTANRCVSLIKAAFNWGIDAGRWSGANPAGRVKKNRENSRTRYLLPVELARFFAALADTEEPAKSFFTLALLTGALKSNVLAMRWADVNMHDAVWTIRDDEAKAGEQMTIPLVPEALEVLKRIKQEQERGAEKGKAPQPWVFPAESKTGHYQEPKRAWATLLRRAEIQDLRIHDLRRTMGSWLVRTGASTAINAKALGHKSLQAAGVYQRIADHDPVRDAMHKASTAMLGTKAEQGEANHVE
jgi:integrase